MSDEKRTTSGGIGLAWVITVVFIVLKAVGVITWSWWWVFSPIWITFALGGIIIVFLIITVLIKDLINDIER